MLSPLFASKDKNMVRLHLSRFRVLFLCFLSLSLHTPSAALRLRPGKHASSDAIKKHKAPMRHASHHRNDSLASRRSTYRINLPLKVAKLIFPQMTGAKNTETVIRIYPDKSLKAQNKNDKNLVLSVNYNKLNDDGSPKPKRRGCYYGTCPGCCPSCCSVCCPGCPCRPAPSLPMPGLCICPARPICPQPCCMSCAAPASPPPPPPPPKPPPAPPCPMVCLPICPPCPKPCRPPCRPVPCIPRPCVPRPCRIPAPPVTGPAHVPCVPAPPVMGPCHPPCMPQDIPPVPIHPAPPMFDRRPIVVDHPMKGPPIYIDQCRDTFPECKAFAKSGMCNHPSPFHNIKQIRKLCAFSCGICNDYDENAALLRRHQSSMTSVPPGTLENLRKALQQIMRNKLLMGESISATQRNNLKHRQHQQHQQHELGEKKSYAASKAHQHRNSHESPTSSKESGSGKADEDLPEDSS